MTATDGENVSYYDVLASDYELFFSDLNRNMDEEGDWLASVLRGFNVRTVLDAACGSGRQAIPLCARGFEVTAADPSAAMLRQADITAREHGVKFPTLNTAFADLSSHFQGDFDAVITLGNGLCNLERPEDIEQALRSMYVCCRSGGVCLVGIKDFEAIKGDSERFHGHQIVDRDDARTILFEAWDFQDPVLVSTAYVVTHPRERGEATVRSAQTREYMLHEAELRTLAGAAGFMEIRRLDHPNEATFALLR